MTALPGADMLAAMGEIAVALLGFSGLAGVFGARTPAVSIRLWVMIAFAFALLLLALLPVVLYELGVEVGTVWGVSSTAIAAFCIGHIALISPRVFKQRRAHAWGTGGVLNYLFPLTLFACLVSQILNAAGLILDRDFGGFLLGMVLLLACSGFNFMDLIAAYREQERQS